MAGVITWWRRLPEEFRRNPIPFTAENENENGHSFSAENENESHLIILVFFLFHTFSHQVSPSMRRQCPVSPFLQMVLVDGIPLSSCTVYRYLCGSFLDDISTREQFAFLVYCYRVKAIFHNLCTVLYWRLCGLTNSPHC